MSAPRSDKTGHDDAASVLGDHLAASGLIGPGASWVSLSGGRTNRLWHVKSPTGELVVKLFASCDRNPLFANDPDAEERLLAHLSGTELAPQLFQAGKSPAGQYLVYAHVPGRMWTGDPGPVADALGRLHRIPPPSGLPLAPDGSAAIAEQTRRILEQCPGPRSQDLLALEPRRPAVAPTATACLLHGDCVPGNLILGPRGLTLIDWQCPTIGDPLEDISTFLSPAMQAIYRHQVLSPVEAHSFLDAFRAPDLARRYAALAPWYHWRMAAYCLWKSQQGDRDYESALTLELAMLSQ